MGLVELDFVGFAISILGITCVIRGILQLDAFFSDQAKYLKHEVPSFGFQKLGGFAQIVIGAMYVIAGFLGCKIPDVFKANAVLSGVGIVVQFILMIGIGTNDDYESYHQYNKFYGSLNFAVPTYDIGVHFMVGAISIILYRLYKGGNSSNPLVPV